jgi:hypothetical protein
MAEKIETTLKADYLPILDNTNYTNWSGRIKVHLCGKDLWNVCTVPVNPLATDDKKEKYTKSNYEAIEIIIPRLNACCYNEVVNKDTIDTATLLWQKITNQYASHSVVDLGCVFMCWICQHLHSKGIDILSHPWKTPQSQSRADCQPHCFVSRLH